MKKTETESAKAAGETEEVNNWKNSPADAGDPRSVLFVGCNTFIPLYWIHNFGQSSCRGRSSDPLLHVRRHQQLHRRDALGPFRLPADHPALLRGPDPLHRPLRPGGQSLCRFRAPAAPRLFLVRALQSMVVLGQKYLAKNIGFASGVTLGLATSMGGIVARGWIADGYGLPAPSRA
ncbi:MAG: hypothetical protein ACLRWP_02670 [Bilophila wadsworthia]